jgi:hypothetical protein
MIDAAASTVPPTVCRMTLSAEHGNDKQSIYNNFLDCCAFVIDKIVRARLITYSRLIAAAQHFAL